MTTKMEHLERKIERLQRDASETMQMLAQAERELRASRDTTPYPSGPQTCAGCGERLHCEYEFWSHFHVPNATYLNLGDCPKGGKR